jgi:hypothetical protein
VFDASISQTLFLFVDLKTTGAETWPHVVRALEPLRSQNYLSRVNGSVIIPGPVTVIGTGNTPLKLVSEAPVRDYFYDGPLLKLDSEGITRAISPVASCQFSAAVGELKGRSLDVSQRALVGKQIADAHAKGIMVRYWDLPSWPVSTRNAVWRELVHAGVDLLNVDDLEAAAGVLRERGGW